MTAPNYFGYTESENAIALRAQRRLALAISYEVFNASSVTDEEIEALDKALEACANDPAHIAVATEFVNLDLTRKLLPAPKIIVTKEFAERWTTNPEHYKEHYGKDAEIK